MKAHRDGKSTPNPIQNDNVTDFIYVGTNSNPVSLVWSISWKLDDLKLAVPRAFWEHWQTLQRDGSSYELDFRGCDIINLQMCRHHLPADTSFMVKLLTDDFRKSEYLEHGALALIPEAVVNVIQSCKPEVSFNGIPMSVKDLFSDGESYASREYGTLDNPERVLLGKGELPAWEEARLEDSDEDMDW